MPQNHKNVMEKNPWLNHVKQIQKDNPKIPFKEVLKEAKKSYKKSKSFKPPKKRNSQIPFKYIKPIKEKIQCKEKSCRRDTHLEGYCLECWFLMRDKKHSIICIREVNENLRRVRLGQELTRPLKQLNTHCEFKNKYQEWCNIQDGLPEDTEKDKEKIKEYKHKYYQKPRVKDKAKKWKKQWLENIKIEKKEYYHKRYVSNSKARREYQQMFKTGEADASKP